MPNLFEEAVSKGAGKTGALSAKIRGLHGVFNKLVEQHREAATLLERASRSNDPAKRSDLWHTIRKELLSHERAELQVVYPALANSSSLQPLIENHDREAQALEAVIFEIDGLDTSSTDWERALTRLQSLVKEHVEKEEGEIFPRAQDLLKKEGAERLEERFTTAKQHIMKNLQ